MHHRRIERRHLLDGLGQRLRLLLQVLIQPPVPLPPRLRLLPPELLPEVLAHQRVGVEPLVLLLRSRSPARRSFATALFHVAPADARQRIRQPGIGGSARSAAISSSSAGRSKSPSIWRIATSGFPSHGS